MLFGTFPFYGHDRVETAAAILKAELVEKELGVCRMCCIGTIMQFIIDMI